MNYGFAFFPSKQLQDFANSYRKRYDSHYALIPPHVTLKQPFEVNNSDIHVIIHAVNELTKQAEPFSLQLYKVDTFFPQNNKIYLKIRKTQGLNFLYEGLHSESLGVTPEQAFIPHLTIGQDLTNDEHFDVLNRLKMEKVNYEETIDRIQLLYQLENGSWTVYETFHLGKGC